MSPTWVPLTMYGGSTSRPSAPASEAAFATSIACPSVPPAPAMTGTRPATAETAVRTTDAASPAEGDDERDGRDHLDRFAHHEGPRERRLRGPVLARTPLIHGRTRGHGRRHRDRFG